VKAKLESALLPDTGFFLHGLFERKVDENPNRTALVGANGSLSYGELEVRANQLAHLLRGYDLGPGELVGIYYHRWEEPIVAILACLKAGVGYVPIDPVYPADRVQFILEQANISVVLTEKKLFQEIRPLVSGQCLTTDLLQDEISKQPDTRINSHEIGLSPSDICYVIYTSGTTGRPKGVVAEHRNAYRYTLSFNKACGTTVEDRIYQGFALGFDGSIEEIWMAFSNGSSLVVPNHDTAKFGNDLAGYLIEKKVTYFSTVPTLLSTITVDIPTLTQLIVSGEACPPELVDRWVRPGLSMYNVYGPTEATVNTTSTLCLPGRPITIGRPLEGYELFILDSSQVVVPSGEKGELYVAGETLARGYLNLPELTAQKFITAPLGKDGKSIRLYRTGDLVRWNDDGELEFFGRIDGQVKIRGYRIELSEIESVLMDCAGVQSAAVRVYERDGLKHLAAYAVPEGAESLDRSEILKVMKKRLPDYMVPTFLDFIDEFPVLASGKVSRRELPEPHETLSGGAREQVLPSNPVESKILEVWKQILGMPSVSTTDNFFNDLGGYSLLAAQMVTKLRDDYGWSVAIRDAYRYPTIQLLAQCVQHHVKSEKKTAEPKKSSREVYESLPLWERVSVKALQALTLLFFYNTAVLPFCLFIWVMHKTFYGNLSILAAVGILVLIGVLAWPFSLAMAVISKWLVLGRIKPGVYPLWSFYYFRWWFSQRLQGMSGSSAFSGTPLMSVYYRLMGAKVGKNCTIDTALCGAWDCVSIGDDTSVGSDSQLLGYQMEDGNLVIGTIDIGDRCFIGLHSALGMNTKMGNDSLLDDQSYLPNGSSMQDGEARQGSPARIAKVSVAIPATRSVPRRPVLFSFLHMAMVYFGGFLMLPFGVAFLGLLVGGFVFLGPYLGLLLVSVPVGIVAYCFYISLVKYWILPEAKPGIYPLDSVFYLRKWFSDGLMRVNRGLLKPVFTTIYLPPWLRLMGAKIGQHTELSTVWFCAPELMEASDESFFADGCIIGGRRTHLGQMEIGINRVGRRSFVGNGAILPMGASLHENNLLGVLSVPPSDEKITDGSEWLGSPAFSLPNRKKVEGFNLEQTFRPSRRLYSQRAVIDGLRILIPAYVGFGTFLLGMGFLLWSYVKFGVVGMVILAPWFGLALQLSVIAFVSLLKKAVMGSFQKEIKPLWSMYVWLNEMVNGSYESLMTPSMSPFLGTPFIAPFLRMIGIKIGKHCYVASVLFSEFDLIEIGDFCALNVGSVLQTHRKTTYEDKKRYQGGRYRVLLPEVSNI